MPWPSNNQISRSDIHMNDKAGQQLRCKIGNDHKSIMANSISNNNWNIKL